MFPSILKSGNLLEANNIKQNEPARKHSKSGKIKWVHIKMTTDLI